MTASRLQSSFPVLVLLFSGIQNTSASTIESVRAQVEAGMGVAGGVRAAVAEFIMATRKRPENNAEVGVPDPHALQHEYVNSITVTANGILIEYGGTADSAISGRVLTLKPEIVERRIRWSCFSNYIDSIYLPDECRQAVQQSFD